jgi:ribose-phosphate pyrophosphokinase
LKERGARRVLACCTHAVLSGPAMQNIEESPIEELVITDTIPLDAAKRAKSTKITVLSVAPLLGNAICRIHKDDSVSELFDSHW